MHFAAMCRDPADKEPPPKLAICTDTKDSVMSTFPVYTLTEAQAYLVHEALTVTKPRYLIFGFPLFHLQTTVSEESKLP